VPTVIYKQTKEGGGKDRTASEQTMEQISSSEESSIMSNDLTTIHTDNGWDDAAAEAGERLLRGTLLRFADWNWTSGKEAIAVEKGTRLVAVGTAAAWVFWQNGKPARTIVRQPGRPLPDREELGDLDEDQWELGPDNRPKDPWQNTRFVYLIDPDTAKAFTFSTSSWGGRGAVIDLADDISRMRKAHPGAVPVVELQAAPMQTKYGRKSKPVLKIVGWKTAGGPAVERQVAEKQLPPPTAQEELDDEIPF
jgi:hypothetical protein